jgi:hypothetical protein
MILMSLLLAALTFNPPMAPHAAPTQGYIQSDSISPDNTNCKPGVICASATINNLAGCFINNFYNGSKGGTPLTIDVTQTGGSKVYVYWVNATNKTITIFGNAQAKYYCPPSS